MRLIDTDILIDLSRGVLDPKVIKWDGTEYISDVSYMEFLQGCRNQKEVEIWKKTSRRFILEPVSSEISVLARHLMELYHLGCGLMMGDALIAATAINLNLTLFTKNKKHYHFLPGLKAKFL